ncbi:hypothetical protein Poli38472_007310 [Pythium oligandrum]|uniref:Transmembrane protein n=1 Tax=Pythium oligandrum TaxID=41045 RepID=A0A8K1CAA5_PYTOL|nr:hypothetical protein Poli38472_007310 [Pythium oligandrum]|eukprot:TMW59165.1 hypothetical protein Poli38472_007310 [Pythium oligandrum]
MMDMQEIKERKRARPQGNEHEEAEAEAEVDPSVPLVDATGRRIKSKRSSIEKGIQYVVDRFWPTVFLTLASVGLYELRFVHALLYASHANRLFVNLFILCSTLVVLFGSYIEVYRNLYMKEKVSYETAKTSTHGMLLCMVLAGLFFIIGMWPVWGWLTLPYLFMWFWGVIVQVVVIFPVQLQRVIFGIAYFWFMHSYLSLFVV